MSEIPGERDARSGQCLDTIYLNGVKMIFTALGLRFMVVAMSETVTVDEPRPYHHGDLRRGLVGAALKLLEREGPNALSLRAVAREAGVSPAAPYHHFKDKNDLLKAIAGEGFDALAVAMAASMQGADNAMTAIGVAYVQFARDNPALYRVMSDCSKDEEEMPDHAAKAEGGAYNLVRRAMIIGQDPVSEIDLELATIAAWCAAHGLAEMRGFKQFKSLKKAMGGEDAFLRGVLSHLGLYSRPKT